MTTRIFLVSILFAISCISPALAASDGNAAPVASDAEVARILDQLEARYNGKNFSADFEQESTLKAMEITDTAKGKAWFKHPGKMRWEYQTPEKYVIISGGENLWIYRPADNQVVVGDAREYFGNGKGASFLSNFKLVRESFSVSLDLQTATEYQLKLVPLKKQYDLSAIFLTVSSKNFDIVYVVTENVYGDITRIAFENLVFHPDLEGSLFDFKVPKGVDVVRMDEATE